MLSPLSRHFNASTKPNPPKKRSIAEILTVAPPIQPTPTKSTGPASASLSPNKGLKKTKKKGKVEKRGDSTADAPLNNDTKNRKKKMKKNNSFFNDNLTKTNKEDGYLSKVQTPAYSFRKITRTIGNKMVSLHRKKLGSKMLWEEQKQYNKDCDSVGKQVKEASPGNVILKKNLKQVSGKRSSGSYRQDNSSEESDCDDALSPKKGNSFETIFNKSSDVVATSSVKEQWSGSDENSLKPCINQEESKHFEEKSESLAKVPFCNNDSLHLFHGSNISTPNCSPSTVEDVQVECESGSFSSIGKFIHHLENTTFQVDANTRTFLEPTSCYSAPYDQGSETPEFPLQTYGENDNSFPFTDLCSSRHFHPFDSNLNLMRNRHIEQIQSDPFPNPKGIGTISLKESSDHISQSSSQPTVRLMGKDVPIGRSSEEIQRYDGDVRADEESRRKHYSKFAALENSSLGRSSKQDRVSGSPLRISSENVLQPAKIQNHQALQFTLLMNGSESEFPYCVSQKGSFAVSRYACSYSHSTTQEPTSCAVFKRTPDYFAEHSIPGDKLLRLSSRSQVLTTNDNFSQMTCLSNGELNDRNRNPHVTKSAFEFPFLNPAVDEQAKTSWPQRPYRTSPPWLSSSTDERRVPVTFAQQVSSASSQSFPPNFWGNNFIAPPENPLIECLYPSTHLSSLCPTKTPFYPTQIVQPQHVLVMPSAINNGCRSTNKVFDRIKLENMTTKDHHHPCTNTRKRLAMNFDDSRKPIKLPNI